MTSEKTGFRKNMALLDERFPGKDFLTVTEVAALLGRDRRTVKKKLTFNRLGLISKADLAREICV